MVREKGVMQEGGKGGGGDKKRVMKKDGEGEGSDVGRG